MKAKPHHQPHPHPAAQVPVLHMHPCSSTEAPNRPVHFSRHPVWNAEEKFPRFSGFPGLLAVCMMSVLLSQKAKTSTAQASAVACGSIQRSRGRRACSSQPVWRSGLIIPPTCGSSSCFCPFVPSSCRRWCLPLLRHPRLFCPV